MVFHVGFNAENGEVAAYDTNNKDNIQYFQTESKEDVKLTDQIDEIVSKLNGELGCACFFIKNGTSNFRKAAIEYGLKKGFSKVELLDSYSQQYIDLALQTNIKPKNGDIIFWISNLFHCNIWRKTNNKAKFIEKTWWDLTKQRPIGYFKNPNIIFLNTNVFSHTILEKRFPLCHVISYKPQGLEKSAMIKALIMANDEKFTAWDTWNVLDRDIVISTVEPENVSNLFLRIKEPRSLPLTRSLFLKRSRCSFNSFEINDDFSLLFDDDVAPSLVLPDYENINFIFTIDNNGIFSTNFYESSKAVYPRAGDVIVGEKLSERQLSNKNPIPNKPIFASNNDFMAKKIAQKSKTFVSGSPFKYSYTIPSQDQIKNKTSNAIGIDLGTSRCCAAVNRKSGITTIPLDNTGERLLPSYIAYDEKRVKCGKVVVERLRYHSKCTIFDAKRLIGKNISDIQRDPTWPFKVIRCNENQLCMEIENFEGKCKISPEQVSAELLKHIKQKSEEFQGTLLKDVVITVPAAFTEAQKLTTFKAAKLSGWEKIYFLPEPVAAAFPYFIDRSFPIDSNVLVFDLGGGTLDVCILKIENDQIYFISSTGDINLGGRDFDSILIEYFKNELNIKYNITLLKDMEFKLMLLCQKIKEELSLFESSCLDLDDIDGTKEGSIYITKKEFEEMTSPLLKKIRKTINSALFNAGRDVNEIAKVLQVGGGSRMPMIKNMLLDIFPEAEHCCKKHPEEVVAIGAAYYACSIFSSSLLTPPVLPLRTK